MAAERANWRWAKLGFTLADYDRIIAEQDGKCAICRRPPKTRRLDVDHDHRTGKVRGLLCHTCNRWLAARGVTPAKLRAAADYLERSTTL